MFLRRTKVSRADKVLVYTQLVESYRRPEDGRPTHRILANLGQMREEEFQNLRLALRAGKKGRRVVLAKRRQDNERPPKPEQNLRYLDLAVLLDLWRNSGLGPLVDKLLDDGEHQARGGDVVAALVLQQCIEPNSKLGCTRWLPRTALPEMLGLLPGHFNNTRIHRVLETLEAVTPALMDRMPSLARWGKKPFVSLFLDVSDASFEGRGPALAERGKTKDGRLARKIGVVLLCSDEGYPLRWDVVHGNCNDTQSMGNMLASIRGLSWTKGTPLVVDRAMGRTAQIRQMHADGVLFVTALTSTEFDAYAEEIPWQHLEDLAVNDQEDGTRDAAVEQARSRARDAGMEEVSDTLLVLDLGLVQRQSPRAANSESSEAELSPDSCARAMSLCRQIDQLVAEGIEPSYNAAGRSLGLGRGPVTKYRQMGKLPKDIQEEVLAGAAQGISLLQLIKVASLDKPDQQRETFRALTAPFSRPNSSVRPSEQAMVATPPGVAGAQPPLRAVVYFNPEQFVNNRSTADEKLQRAQQFVQDLNQRLCTRRSYRSPEAITSAVDRALRRDGLAGVFDVAVTSHPGASGPIYRAQLTLDKKKWDRRRRFDGFVVLVAHPDISLSAAELSHLYRAKDAVEKNFQTIKSVNELAPVRHRTDPKVRAHVTMCMLALFLERHLRRLLRGKCSAEQALDTLGTCHLNRYAVHSGDSQALSAYTVTALDEDQTGILNRLRLSHLSDDDYVAAAMRGSR